MSMPSHQLFPKRDVHLATAGPESAADDLEISLGDLSLNVFGIEKATIKPEQNIFEGGVIQDGLISFSIPTDIHEQLQKCPGFDAMCSSTGNLEEVPAVTPVVLLQGRIFDPRILLTDFYQEMKAHAASGQPFDLSKYRPHLGEIEMSKEAGVDTLYAELAAEYVEKVLHPGRIEETARSIDESARFDFERRDGLYNPHVNGISLPALPSAPIQDPHYDHFDYHYEED